MATADDVAAFILKRMGKMTAMKLQKLLYYAQGWSLVWDEKPLYGEKIEAWVNGPVVTNLYAKHKGLFELDSWPVGSASKLTKKERETVNSVLDFYGEKSSQWLSDLTHLEAPWSDARKGLPTGARSRREISHASMAEYYGSL